MEIKQLQRYFNSAWLKFSFDTLFQLARDPWQYTSAYEQWKYEQELQLLPLTSVFQALELGCAEGIFTVQLAARVQKLVAADISPIALMRANQRCVLHQCENVKLIQFDITQDELPSERFDLIVCSETLYYVGNQTILQEVAQKLTQALKPNGYLLTSNDYRVKTSPHKGENFSNSRVFGAEVIGATLSQTLQLVKVIRTPFHCTHLFQRSVSSSESALLPEIVSFSQSEIPQPQKGLFDWFSIAAIANGWCR